MCLLSTGAGNILSFADVNWSLMAMIYNEFGFTFADTSTDDL